MKLIEIAYNLLSRVALPITIGIVLALAIQWWWTQA